MSELNMSTIISGGTCEWSRVGYTLAPAKIVLSLSNRDLKSIDGLEKYTSLRVLDLSQNHLTSLKQMHELRDLQTLNASRNRLCELLDFAMNDDVEGAQTQSFPVRQLRHVNMSNNVIVDPIFQVHEPFPYLHSLNVSGNRLTTLQSFSGLRYLKVLDASNNSIVNVDGIDGLHLIVDLYLQNNQITTLIGMRNSMTNLRYLDISNNLLTDLDGLGQHLNLAVVHARSNALTSVNGIAHLMKLRLLRDLDLTGNSILQDNQFYSNCLFHLPGLTTLNSINVTPEHVFQSECSQGVHDKALQNISELLSLGTTSISPLSSTEFWMLCAESGFLTPWDRFLSDLPEVSRIFLDGIPIGPVGFKVVRYALDENPNILELSLNDTSVYAPRWSSSLAGCAGLDALHGATENIQSISLSHCNLDTASKCSSIAKLITGTPNLRFLDLSSNRLGSCGNSFAEVMGALGNGAHLARINLSYNQIGADAASGKSLCRFLGSAISSSAVTLDGNPISSSVTLGALFGALRDPCKLSSFSVRSCGIQGDVHFNALQQLSRSLSMNKSLKHIDLSENRIGSLGTAALAHACEKGDVSRVLGSISLSNCMINLSDDAFSAWLARMSKSITSLNLSGNESGCLATSVHRFSTLQSINLSNCQNAIIDFGAIAQLIETQTLKSCRIGHSLINDDIRPRQSFSRAISNSTSLTTLDISFLPVDEGLIEAIGRCLSLLYLDISECPYASDDDFTIRISSSRSIIRLATSFIESQFPCQLKSLDLSGVDLTYRQRRPNLLSALQSRANTLRELCCHRTRLGSSDDEIGQILAAIVKSSCLRYLRLSHCNLEEPNYVDLVQAIVTLEEPCSISWLDLSGNSTDHVGLKLLAHMLSSNLCQLTRIRFPALTVFMLEGSPDSDHTVSKALNDVINILGPVIAVNNIIETIDLSETFESPLEVAQYQLLNGIFSECQSSRISHLLTASSRQAKFLTESEDFVCNQLAARFAQNRYRANPLEGCPNSWESIGRYDSETILVVNDTVH